MNPIAIIEKYYQKDSALYETLMIHSRAVQKKALEIVRRNPHLGADEQFVAEAALLHDIGIFKTDAPRIFCQGSYPYIAHGYLGADLLRQEGFPKHALVCERHTGCGLSVQMIKERALPVPCRAMEPVSIEEQIICFADKFYSKTRLNEELALATVRTKMAALGSLNKFDDWYLLFYGEKLSPLETL